MDDLAIREQESSLDVQTIDLSGDIPSLKDAKELPVDLCGNYWSPVIPGEFKKVIFLDIKPQKVLSQTTGELIDLDCVMFAEQNENGDLTTTMNGSVRLVGALQPYFEDGIIKKEQCLKLPIWVGIRIKQMQILLITGLLNLYA
ncbi:hypothetical protein NXY25_27635 [Bacteroides thetaiotaomicron]|nr:hypothetical protein [Bacteroides thetaiotaomicron]